MDTDEKALDDLDDIEEFSGLEERHNIFISGQTLLNDWLNCEQKCNNFGYLSIQVWLKGNDRTFRINSLNLVHLVHN